MSIRSNYMDNDALADLFRDGILELHAKIAELPDGSFKRRMSRLANIAHGALETIQEGALDQGMIQPFSGGDPKPPTGP